MMSYLIGEFDDDDELESDQEQEPPPKLIAANDIRDFDDDGGKGLGQLRIMALMIQGQQWDCSREDDYDDRWQNGDIKVQPNGGCPVGARRGSNKNGMN